jgi:transcriptional regulator with XRE-family HTH domain
MSRRERKPPRSAPKCAGADATARVARQLAQLRAARGETQKQLALRLGMTDSMISRLESGSHSPTLTTLCRLAEGFGRRLEIAFHEHEHQHADGTRHTHVHGHADGAHRHDHGESG